MTGPETVVSRVVVGANAVVNPCATSALIYCNGTTDTIQVQGYTPGTVTTFLSTTNGGFTVNMIAVLQQVGPQGLPGPATITAGNRVLIASQTVSAAVATVDFLQSSIGDGSYDIYEADIYNFSTAANVGLQARFSTDGATFDASSGVYGYSNIQMNSGGTAGGSYVASATYTQLGSATGSQAQAVGQMRSIFYELGNSGFAKYVLTPALVHTTGSGVATTIFAGWYNAPPYLPVRGIRFFPSSGNISQGTFNLYGIHK